MGNSTSAPPTVKNFDPVFYSGNWWDTAHYPNPFQVGCVRSQAYYSWNSEKERLRVVNTCNESNGEQREVKGFATIPNSKYPGRLEVVFSGVPGNVQSGQSNYWIHWTDYVRYAIVGNGNRSQLWILSREETIPRADFEMLVLAVKGLGYSPSRMVIAKGGVKGISPINTCNGRNAGNAGNAGNGGNGVEIVQYQQIDAQARGYYDCSSSSSSSSDYKFWDTLTNQSKYEDNYEKNYYHSDFKHN